MGNDGKIADFVDVDHDLLCNLKRAEMAWFSPCYTTISDEIPHLIMVRVKVSRSFSCFNLPLVRILSSSFYCDKIDISNSLDKEKLMPSLRHEKYRPFIGPDLGDRTWPSQQ
ncbi:hypothetical protein N9D90_03185, partial [Alphaproteobacteria bacterium]|nr:hypothetical protein [Alphaproteobacteria bacterium]